MSDETSMRDRFDSGSGMLFMYALPLGAAWFWHQHTSASSLWWGISGVLIIGGVVGMGRGMYLVLSSSSGFGRNFHEEREPLDPSPDDESYDRDAAIGDETQHVWLFPVVLLATGVLASSYRMWPGMMTPDGIFDPDFAPYDLLVLWIFAAGLGIICWTVTTLVMMMTGPDRWAFVPGARDRIRSSMWKLLVCGVVLVAIAVAFAINGETGTGNGEARLASRSVLVGESAVSEIPITLGPGLRERDRMPHLRYL